MDKAVTVGNSFCAKEKFRLLNGFLSTVTGYTEEELYQLETCCYHSVKEIGQNLSIQPQAMLLLFPVMSTRRIKSINAKVIDVTGKYLASGFIDIHQQIL